MRFKFGFCLGIMALASPACTGGAGSEPHGSSTLAFADGRLYVTSSDDGKLAIFDLEAEKISARIALGKEPARIARAGDRLFVTLRADRSVAALDLDGAIIGRIDAGAEPYGIVAAPSGAHVYVASSISGKVLEIDTLSLKVSRSWEISDEPRWLAIHPGGDLLVVAAAFGDFWHTIDLRADSIESFRLPEVTSSSFVFTSSNTVSSNLIRHASRVTGDPTFSADGTTLLLPVLSSDVETPFVDTAMPGPFTATGYYQNRFSGSVVKVPFDGARAINERSASMSLAPFGGGLSYPSSVNIAPTGDYAIATFENSKFIAALVLAPRVGASFQALTGGDGGVAAAGSYGSSGTLALPGRAPGLSGGTISSPFLNWVVFPADFGAVATAFTGDKVWVHSPLRRSMSAFDRTLLEIALFSESELDRAQARASLLLGRPIEVTERVLDPQVERGRQLFFSANDGVVSGAFGGVACATCHFEGRTDGLTWTFLSRGARQTPSLAGPVSATLPLRWDGSAPSLIGEIIETSQVRMGGSGLSEEDALALAKYVDSTRDVDSIGEDSAAAQRGRELFYRGDVGCATCHSGARFTDNTIHTLGDRAPSKTRALIGIRATAPYFHDGSAATLRDVLQRSKDGSMGDTSRLTEEELRDLEMFLRSL